MEEFNNKVVVITGGSRGIGKKVALKLAAKGAKVAITYHQNSRAAQDVIKEIEGHGAKGFAYQNNCGDFKAVRELINIIKCDIGEIDYLVNNAGIGINKSFYLLSEEDWDQVVQTNLKGVFNFCRNVMLDFLKKKSGVIVNIASVAGFRGLAGQASYCATKAGIINLTRAIAREVGRAGIRINAVAPGYIDTDMTRSIRPELVEGFLTQIPCGKFGEPNDVAEVVLFLLSSKSRYVLGETIVVDGGLSI